MTTQNQTARELTEDRDRLIAAALALGVGEQTALEAYARAELLRLWGLSPVIEEEAREWRRQYLATIQDEEILALELEEEEDDPAEEDQGPGWNDWREFREWRENQQELADMRATQLGR